MWEQDAQMMQKAGINFVRLAGIINQLYIPNHNQLSTTTTHNSHLALITPDISYKH